MPANIRFSRVIESLPPSGYEPGTLLPSPMAHRIVMGQRDCRLSITIGWNRY